MRWYNHYKKWAKVYPSDKNISTTIRCITMKYCTDIHAPLGMNLLGSPLTFHLTATSGQISISCTYPVGQDIEASWTYSVGRRKVVLRPTAAGTRSWWQRLKKKKKSLAVRQPLYFISHCTIWLSWGGNLSWLRYSTKEHYSKQTSDILVSHRERLIYYRNLWFVPFVLFSTEIENSKLK